MFCPHPVDLAMRETWARHSGSELTTVFILVPIADRWDVVPSCNVHCPMQDWQAKCSLCTLKSSLSFEVKCSLVVKCYLCSQAFICSQVKCPLCSQVFTLQSSVHFVVKGAFVVKSSVTFVVKCSLAVKSSVTCVVKCSFVVRPSLVVKRSLECQMMKCESSQVSVLHYMGYMGVCVK